MKPQFSYLNCQKLTKNELFKHFIEERLTQTPIKIVGAVERHAERGEENWVSEERYLYTQSEDQVPWSLMA